MEYSNSQHHRRRVERIALTLPVRIEAKESQENVWSEITRFQTVSSCGAGFEIQHQVKTGQILLLTSPIPQRLRCYDYTEQQYRVWSLVRYCNPAQSSSSVFQTGVAFVGKYPPLSFHDNPATLYDLSGFSKQGFSELRELAEEPIKPPPPENTRKNAPRHPIPFEVLIETLDQNNKTVISEKTVSENVSVSGAAVFTSLNVQIDDTVRVYFRAFNVSIIARVCNRRIGPDGMPRLHLEFIDRQLPLEGIE